MKDTPTADKEASRLPLYLKVSMLGVRTSESSLEIQNVRPRMRLRQRGVPRSGV